MSLGAERRFVGQADTGLMPLSVGVTLHIRADTPITSRVDPREGMAVVRFVGPMVAGATLFLSRGGLVHVRDVLSATLADLDAGVHSS